MGRFTRLWPPRPSHLWLLICNIGIMALIICLLASCRSPTESSYSLLNFDREFFKKVVGDKCFDASEGIVADTYRIGLAGSCRMAGGTVSCKSHSPKLGWIALFEADVAVANLPGEQGAALQKCVDTLNKAGVDNAFTNRLAVAFFALLIVSAILNVAALVAAFVCGSGFGLPVFIIGLIDEVTMVTCIGIFVGIINHEVGRYIPPSVSLGDIDDKAALGVGFWMLVAVFAARAISHPLLFFMTLVICLLIIFVPIFILLCCLGGESRDRTVIYVKARVEDAYGTTRVDKQSRW